MRHWHSVLDAAMIVFLGCLLAIKLHSPEKPSLIFVSSRRQTRLTALDLIAFLAADDNPKQWLHMPEAEVSVAVDLIAVIIYSDFLHLLRLFCVVYWCVCYLSLFQ